MLIAIQVMSPVRSKSHKLNSPRARHKITDDALPAIGQTSTFKTPLFPHANKSASAMNSPVVESKPIVPLHPPTVKEALELKLISEIKEISDGRANAAASTTFGKKKEENKEFKAEVRNKSSLLLMKIV